MASLNLENNQCSTDHAENHPVDDDALQDDPSTPIPSTSQYRQTSPRLTFTDPFASGEPKQTPNGQLDSRHSYGPSSLTPAARTGPPRSLSFTYNYTIPSSFSSSNYINRNTGDILEEPTRPRALTESDIHDDPSTYDLTPRETQFRGPFDTTHQEQKDRHRDATDGRGKRREISRWDDFKSRWLPEALAGSPTEEQSGIDWGKDKDKEDAQPNGGPSPRKASSAVASGSDSGLGLPRSQSSVQDKGKGRELQETQTQGSKSPTSGWSRLRFLIPSVISPVSKESTPPSAVTTGDVNITDELLVGGLSVLMLRLWFERDERDRRRVPMLLHRLRIRISDSLHPLGGAQSVFRIECEYANGAMRWVIYRQLRDFLSLHAHYAVSNAYNRNVEKLPEFPRTSIPYFKFLKKESRERGGEVGRADFARLQREVLESYLVNLIRAVMFHPTSNRLAGFLEVSALCIHLANSGGVQYKAGYLRIVASSNKGAGLGRKSAGRRQKKKQKWCAVRESYLVAVEEAGELVVWDVFLLDADFKIERPTRYYRQGLNLLHGDSTGEGGAVRPDPASPNTGRSGDSTGTDRKALLGSIRSRLSHVLHPRSDSRHAGTSDAPGHVCEHHVREDADSLDPDSRPPTPMLDPSTNTNPLNEDATHAPHPPQGGAQNKKKRRASGDVSKHTFYIENSQMKLKLYARSERQMLQWIAGLEKAAATSPFAASNRFGSFAPIRLNVAAQWLVDGPIRAIMDIGAEFNYTAAGPYGLQFGLCPLEAYSYQRDYFWNLSRAILLAKDTIYIHDWWLSPELSLRRPGLPKYRLDKLLEKKAKEGVKIFIILYQEVSNRTTPTDSNYAKQRLSTLHPNILVQRSPSHFQTGTFYWAHHEKLCVIDSSIAFMGGLDLCFGRWDTPQHSLVDDPEEGEEPIWPGKDYSNARITDFHTLTKPEEDLHDRSKIPRMPWHDVGLQIVGQPARDLGRHFVQRWNYLLRIKNHSRLMPFLLPPPEYKPGELSQLGLTGTCELQICRSAGPWSLGTPDKVECSIQNAYLKAIQLSEHFVYIENQFFITSTMVDDVAIENKIGDAIVHRIIRAHREGTKWRCCIVIPLLPGFPFPVDHTDASSVRIILECQNRTIGRGPNSIFSRLRKEGINPDDHICLFSLRSWAKLRGDVLTTELVYIHGKVCIVDDRLAIIGSANINERSQRGDRDSELAAVIRDTDLIDGKMAGKPFKVGRFSHTLRVRLMREHIGIDVDALDDEGVRAHGSIQRGNEAEFWDPDNEQIQGRESVTEKGHHSAGKVKNTMRSVVDAIRPVIHGTEDLGSKEFAQGLGKIGLESEPDLRGVDVAVEERDERNVPVFADSLVPTLEEKILAEHDLPVQGEYGVTVGKGLEEGASELDRSAPAEARVDSGHLSGASFAAEMDTQPLQARMGKRDADAEEQKALRARGTLRKQLNAKPGQSPWTILTPKPKYDANSFEDPVSDEFWTNIWVACAVHNTEIFRRVFHAVPDDLVTTWKHYKEFVAHHERLLKPLRDDLAPEPVASVPSTTIKERSSDEEGGQESQESRETSTTPSPDETQSHLTSGSSRGNPLKPEKSISERVDGLYAGEKAGGSMSTEKANGSATADKNKKTRGEPPFTKQEREEMETLLHELCGHLVVYPTRFLEGEDVAKNFLFNTDRLLPLPIYD